MICNNTHNQEFCCCQKPEFKAMEDKLKKLEKDRKAINKLLLKIKDLSK